MKNIVSTQSAIGNMFALGAMGQSIIDLPTAPQMLFSSRDNGETWDFASDNMTKYAIGDHGAFIIMGNNQDISYSISEGKTW